MRIREIHSSSTDNRYFNKPNKFIVRLTNNVLSILKRNPALIDDFSNKLIELSNQLSEELKLKKGSNSIPYDRNISWEIDYVDENGKPHKRNENLVLLLVNPREAILDTPSIDYSSRVPMDLNTTILSLTDIPDSNLDDTFKENLIDKYSDIDDSDFTMEDSNNAWDLVKYNLNKVCSSIIDDITSKLKGKETSNEEINSDNMYEFINKIKTPEGLREYISKELYSTNKGKALYEFMLNNFPLMLNGGGYVNGLGKDVTNDIIYNFTADYVNEEGTNKIKEINTILAQKQKEDKESRKFKLMETENIKNVIRDLFNLRSKDEWANSELNRLISKYGLDGESEINKLKSSLFKSISKEDIDDIATNLIENNYLLIVNDPNKVEEFKNTYANLLYSLSPFGVVDNILDEKVGVNINQADRGTLSDIFDVEDDTIESNNSNESEQIDATQVKEDNVTQEEKDGDINE